MSHKESDIKSQSPSCIKWCKLDWGDKTIIIFLIIQGELINLSKALYKKIDRTQGAINWLTNQCTTKNNIYFGKDKNIELQPTKIQRDVFEYFLKNSGFTNHIYHNNLFLGWRAKKDFFTGKSAKMSYGKYYQKQIVSFSIISKLRLDKITTLNCIKIFIVHNQLSNQNLQLNKL